MSAVGNYTGKGHLYEFGPFRIDPDKQTLSRGGELIALTPKTFQLLLVLLQHGNETVTKDELMKSLWPDTFVEETNLTRNVFALRKALGESEQDRYIITIPGRGYRLAGEVNPVSESRVSILAASHSKVQVQVRETNSRLWIAATVIIALILGAGAYRFLQNRRPILSGKDTVVLADFENSTGDPIFDGALRQGLAVQLEQSPFLSLISEQRIRRTLTLMGRPADAQLTGETAQEVCERTGAAALVEGSIAMLGTQYVLGLRVKNCHTDDVLDEQQQQAARKEDVLNALSQIASRFRGRAGESLASVRKYSTPLAEATTPSLEALKAYSAGWQVHAAHGASASLPFFRRATELDPEFAAAHSSLGRIYEDLDQSDLAAKSIERSWQLREKTSEPERYFLTANYQVLVTGNLETAQQTCEAWAQAYPRDPRPHSMLAGVINKTAGRYENSLDEARKGIELDPDFAIDYYSLGAANVYRFRLEEAESALQAAAARNLDIDEYIMLAYDIAFLKGDVAGMQREAARARARPGGENWMSAREAFVAAFSGQLKNARIISSRAVAEAQQAGQPERSSLWEAGAAVRESLFGNKTQANERATAALGLSHDLAVEYGAALAFSIAGNPSRAQPLADDIQKRFPEDSAVRFSYLPTIRALLALNRGEPERALESLQVAAPHEVGVPRSSVSGLFGALYPVYVRGQAYLAAHKGVEAAAEFQKVLDHRGVVINDPIGALAHLQLARAYTLAGDKARARSAYDGFFALWRNADPDIPILKQAKGEYASLR
jgi:eukaryotic-like serine/threonine-protein kinase